MLGINLLFQRFLRGEGEYLSLPKTRNTPYKDEEKTVKKLGT
jgi:hypothetical protein